MGLYHIAKAVGFINSDCKLVGLHVAHLPAYQTPFHSIDQTAACRFTPTYACGQLS